jgi:hypothetical protein
MLRAVLAAPCPNRISFVRKLEPATQTADGSDSHGMCL